MPPRGWGARRGTLLVGGGVVLAVVLAACSSGSSAPADGASGSSSGSSSSTSGAAASPGATVSRAPSPSTTAAVPGSGPEFTVAAPPPADVHPPAAGADGLPAVVSHVVTTDKVVFITIDDGWTADPALPALLARRQAHVTAFATDDAIRDKTSFLQALRADGATVQNHSLTHPALRNASLATNEKEICGASDRYAARFGQRPWLFRPPFGSWSSTTQQAAKACGIRYLVMWDVSQPGRYLRYADGDRLRPGDIILFHFEKHLAEYLDRTLKIIRGEGLSVGRLEDYLPQGAS